jgi:hypothetical protein
LHDPIVCLISSFREGELIQGAIRSVLPCADTIIVWEGATNAKASSGAGEKTALGKMQLDVKDFRSGIWGNEAQKRNAMLQRARELTPVPFWILTVDADEILVWAEYLTDWLNALRPGYPKSDQNVVPLKITVPGWDEETKHGPVTYIQPSRLVHSSLVKEYTNGLVLAETPDGSKLDFSAYRSETPPLFGEPHIHHRYYLRRPDRAAIRGFDLEKAELKKSGISVVEK